MFVVMWGVFLMFRTFNRCVQLYWWRFLRIAKGRTRLYLARILPTLYVEGTGCTRCLCHYSMCFNLLQFSIQERYSFLEVPRTLLGVLFGVLLPSWKIRWEKQSLGAMDLMAVYGTVQQQHHVGSAMLLKLWVVGNTELQSGAGIENLPGRIAARREMKP